MFFMGTILGRQWFSHDNHCILLCQTASHLMGGTEACPLSCSNASTLASFPALNRLAAKSNPPMLSPGETPWQVDWESPQENYTKSSGVDLKTQLLQ